MGLRSKKSRLDQATDVVEGYVDSVRPHVQAALETAKESTRDFVQETAIPALNDARDKAAPVIADARGKAAPVVADAREKAAAQLSDARTKAAPVVAAGAAAAGNKATAARELADNRVAKIRKEEPKKRSKLKTFLLLGIVSGVVAVVAKKPQGGGTSDNWQSSYVPTPAPAPAPPAQDIGGASPDEALADEVESPHGVTTPDQPAEVIDIDPDADNR